ncbi:hypothetical protein ABE425_09500 [Chryseobacterium cucumeris]|uniref:hypothetical protein n=1 Tax=Chryseobacterium cucumeris TaxID=1813611 RepID=UPI003209E5EE
MIINKIYALSLFLSSTWTFSQNVNEDLIHYLKEAETILITSHEDLRLDIETPGKS